MPSIGTLYTTPVQTTGQLIKAVAALSDLTLDEPTGYVHYETNKTPEYLAKFASGKVPAFEDAEGWTLFEGLPIARYVATLAPNTGLLGHSAKDAAKVDQWIHYVESELVTPLRVIARYLAHYVPYHKPSEQAARDAIPRPLEVLNKHLADNTYLVGERITLADLYAASALVIGFENIWDPAAREKYNNVVRHYNTIRNHPKIAGVWGKTEWAETVRQYVPPAKPAKEEKAKAPKAAAAPKEKAPKPKKEEDADEEEEDLVPAEPKVKNPLDDLPKSNFNLEDWKRAYSNMDTRGKGGSLEWFYEKFDPEGFSIWRVDFKYPEELTKVFMSSNQIGGYFNRLEGSRKYLFGSVGVLGAENDSVISGVFICRGQDYKAVLDAAPDWESYNYERLDVSKDGPQKDYFEAALAWDLEIDGKKWADGKNFK